MTVFTYLVKPNIIALLKKAAREKCSECKEPFKEGQRVVSKTGRVARSSWPKHLECAKRLNIV